jgi:hypothetical protein
MSNRTGTAASQTRARPVDRRVAEREAAARIALVEALRRQRPDIGSTAEVTSRFAAGVRQVAVVWCPDHVAPETRYAVVVAPRFGFTDGPREAPAEVAVVVDGWRSARWRAGARASALVPQLSAPEPSQAERVQAIVDRLVEQIVSLPSEDWRDAGTFGDEATAELLALGVGSQVRS